MLIKKIYNYVKFRLYFCKEIVDAVKRIKFNKKQKTIYLFGVPTHSNIGDQAQTVCIVNWLKLNYSSYKIELFNYYQAGKFVLNTLRNSIDVEDKIFIHSGYHLTDLYNVQDGYCRIINLFKDYNIVIFPQTINYLDNNNLIKTAECINSHPNLTLLCRDEISYSTAKERFTNARLFLYPDIVTALIGTKFFNNKRDGILFCLRNDKEKFYTDDQIIALINRYKGIENTYISDTTLKIPSSEIVKRREEFVNSVINEYSKFKLTITDRYHGVILSLIAGTPVIVISSKDHKLYSGVSWFPESFKDYITYAKDLEVAYSLSIEFLKKERNETLFPYFKENYYDVLKQKLE